MPVQYSSTHRVTSTLYPGVVFLLRRSNEKRRAELQFDLSPLLDTEREILKRFSAVQERQITVKKPDGTEAIDPVSCEPIKEFANLDDFKLATDIIQELIDFRIRHTYGIYIRHYLISVEGLEIDGNAATVDDLVAGDTVPDGMAAEIVEAIQAKTEVPPELKKKSPSPSTSGEPLAEPNPTSAEVVNS